MVRQQTKTTIERDIKLGDKVYIISSRNNPQQLLKGDIVECVGAYAGYIIVKKGINNYNLYYTAPFDEFCLADREHMKKNYVDRLLKLEIELKECKTELDYLNKYSCDEEYVAEKLIEINATNNKDKMIDLLKTLKKSNYL